MKNVNNTLSLLILIISTISTSLIYPYIKQEVPEGKDPRLTTEYAYQRLEGGVYKQYEVDLTPQERYTIQRVLKRHVQSDQDFNKRVTPEFINLVLSGCKKASSSLCNLIEKVLKDFMGRNLEAVFTAIGLSREI